MSSYYTNNPTASMTTKALNDFCVDTLCSTDESTVGTLEEVSSESLYGEELKIIKSFHKPKPEDLVPNQVWLGEKTKRFTLCLDLDETLVYSRQQNEERTATITVRPLATTLLATLSTQYELVIFTAASEDYALQAVSCLDPEGRYIMRVLSNQHCTKTKEGYYVKDLRIIADRRVDEILIVDNSVISFAFQMANGIPVSSYEGDEQDNELDYLSTYLMELAEANDIVATNSQRIGLAELVSY